MAETLPGIVVALTGDASGALKALGATDKALTATGAKARTVERDLGRMGLSLTGALGAMTRPITAASAALGGMTAAASRALNAVSGLGSKLAAAGAVAGAAMAGAVATAAQEDPAAARAMASFQATSTSLGVELTRVVLPAVRAVTQTIADLTAWFRSLDPEVRANIGSWAAFAVQATAAVGIAGKLAGALGGVAALAAPLLPVAAALGLAALAAGALYKSLKDSAGIDVATIKDAWLDFAGTMLGVYSKLGAGWLSIVNTIRESLRGLKEDLANVFRPDIDYAQLTMPGAAGDAARAELDRRTAARRLPEDDWLKQLEAKLRAGLAGEDLRKAMADGGKAAADGLAYSFAGLKDMFKDLGKELGLDELLAGKRPRGTPLSGIPLVPMRQDPFATQSGLAAGPGVFDVSDRAVLAAENERSIAMWQQAMQEEYRLAAEHAKQQEAFAEGAFMHAVQLEEARIAFYDAERARLPSMLQAFATFAEGWHDAFMQLDRETRGIMATAAGALQGMLGKAGGVFEAAAKGMGAGGPLGALVGAGGALLAGSEQAKRFTAVLDTIVQGASDALGTALEPLITTLGGALLAVRPLFEFLGGLLTALLGPLEGLAAPLVALAPVFQALAATVQVVVDLLGGLVGGALGLAFRALFEVFKVVGVIVLGVAYAIQTVWNGIAEAVNLILGGIGDLFGQDWRVFPVADTDATAAALQELTGLTYEAATAKARETAASVNLTDAMRSTAAQLLNVPEVLRVSALRFAASRAEGLPGEMVPAGGAPVPTGGGTAGTLPGEPGAGVTVFIGGQPLRQQLVIERKLNGDRVSAAELEGLFRGGG